MKSKIHKINLIFNSCAILIIYLPLRAPPSSSSESCLRCFSAGKREKNEYKIKNIFNLHWKVSTRFMLRCSLACSQSFWSWTNIVAMLMTKAPKTRCRRKRREKEIAKKRKKIKSAPGTTRLTHCCLMFYIDSISANHEESSTCVMWK